jgi:hypothetical protein
MLCVAVLFTDFIVEEAETICEEHFGARTGRNRLDHFYDFKQRLLSSRLA